MWGKLLLFAIAAAFSPVAVLAQPMPRATYRCPEPLPAEKQSKENGIHQLELNSFGRFLTPEDGDQCADLNQLMLAVVGLQYKLFLATDDSVRIADVTLRAARAKLRADPANPSQLAATKSAEFALLVARMPLGEIENASDVVGATLATSTGAPASTEYRQRLMVLAGAADSAGAYATARDLSERTLALMKPILNERQDIDVARWPAGDTCDMAKVVVDAALAKRCAGASSMFGYYMVESGIHSDAVSTLALASLALGDRARARKALELHARGPNGRTLMLQYAQLLKIEGDSAWRSRAVEARAMAKLDLGIHDPLASYQGQFLASQYVTGDRDVSALSGIALTRAGETELALDRPKVALGYLLAALPSLERNLANSQLWVARTRYLVGQALVADKRPGEALPYLSAASKAVDSYSPSSRDARRLANNWFEGAVDYHLAYLEGSLAAGDQAAAGDALLRASRSRLSRSINAVVARQNAPVEIRAAQDAARIASEADDDLNRATLRGAAADERQKLLVRAEAARRDAKTKLDGALSKWPQFRLFGLGDVPRLGEVEARVPDRHALIIFAVARDRAYAALIRHTGSTIVPIPLSRTELTRLIDKVHASSEFVRTPSGYRTTRYDVASASRLYDALFRPFEGQLGGLSSVAIARTAPLDGLPFAALWDAAHRQWLGDRLAMSLVLDPSLSTRHDAAPRPVGMVLGIGDPQVRAASFLRDLTVDGRKRLFAPAGSRASEGGSGVGLPGATAELETLAKAFPNATNMILTGKRATEGAFRREASRYRIIALATHAVTRSPRFGFPKPAIVFTPVNSAKASDDGLLHADEVESLNLNADLVVLSACETAGGDGQPGSESLSGLAQSFLFAGAQSVLATQWKVESKSASQLISRFATGTFDDRAVRLQQAMRAVRTRPGQSHPAFWAPFVLVEGAVR